MARHLRRAPGSPIIAAARDRRVLVHPAADGARHLDLRRRRQPGGGPALGHQGLARSCSSSTASRACSPGSAGSCRSARLFAANGLQLGQAYELDAIAAVILGGTSFVGGIGSIWGTLIGALIIAELSNGLILMGVSDIWQFIIKGLVIIGAVTLDRFRLQGSARTVSAASLTNTEPTAPDAASVGRRAAPVRRRTSPHARTRGASPMLKKLLVGGLALGLAAGTAVGQGPERDRHHAGHRSAIPSSWRSPRAPSRRPRRSTPTSRSPRPRPTTTSTSSSTRSTISSPPAST